MSYFGISDIQYEHAALVQQLAKDGQEIIDDLTPEKAHLWHMATGVAGEGGELLDAIKRHAIYNKEIDRENVIEELGDLEFYMEGIRRALAIDRNDTLCSNIGKLRKRYNNKYSNQAAQDRADKSVDGTEATGYPGDGLGLRDS